MSLEGQTLGKYRVLEPLGRGGMARVYRAYHPQLDRYVAIKVMRSDLIQEDEVGTSYWSARFRREAQAVAGLRHTHIVQVFDFDVQDDVSYMVMELLDGDSLKARLNDYRLRGDQIPLDEMVRVLLDVLDGLAYAHGAGMIHRDIKPANIMLTQQGQAVLTDFGIAQIVGGTRYTVTGALMGTLNYMAPEQGLDGRCDIRSDIYSLGIVFYEMLTNSVPFDADTPLAILMKHLNDPLPLPRRIVPTIPEPLERIVLKTLAKCPDDRYQSAEEMAQALFEAAEESEIEIPTKISLPLSFTTPEAPSESVAVLSGTERGKILDVKFAQDETDTTLGQRLAAAEAATEAAAEAAPKATTAVAPKAATAVAPKAAAGATVQAAESPGEKQVLSEVREELLGGRQALSEVGKELLGAVGGMAHVAIGKATVTPARIGLRTAIIGAISIVAVYNVIAAWVAGVTRWREIFGRGWPIELLAVSLGLCLIMYATSSIWLLIPAGILLGNAFLFSYCEITGLWRHWAFLWPLEPLLIGGTIWFTIWVAKRGDLARRLSRLLGFVMGLASIAVSILVALATVVIAVVT